MTEESQELTFTFQLSGEGIQVDKDGGQEWATEIEFRSPTSKDMKEVSALKQMFARAMMEVQEKQSPSTTGGGEGGDVTGEMLMTIVTISHEDLGEIVAVGYKLLCSGVGTILGKKLNSTLLAKVSSDELERMVGEYAINFPLKSFLKE
jgi:hypothetical protein